MIDTQPSATPAFEPASQLRARLEAAGLLCPVCGLRPAPPHGLCQRCAEEPVEEQPAAPLPKDPCPYGPGSEEKIEALCQRIKQGVSPWHPLDAAGPLPDGYCPAAPGWLPPLCRLFGLDPTKVVR